MQHSSSARTFKEKLHKLPSSVASEASEWSLGINQHTLQSHEYMCIFSLSDKYYPTHKPSTSKYSVDYRRWNSPLGLKPALQHYILSFEQLIKDSNVAANGIHPILTIPHRPQRGLSAASPGLQSVRERQEHSGGWTKRGQRTSSPKQKAVGSTSSRYTREPSGQCSSSSWYSGFYSAA